mmetsp:Transcript_24102/g.62090  ORF Transcript_24102/g.62090 Transcript_24102/m.62090 type:complete len:126 (-) Transcript_24102:90-467(-)
MWGGAHGFSAVRPAVLPPAPPSPPPSPPPAPAQAEDGDGDDDDGDDSGGGGDGTAVSPSPPPPPKDSMTNVFIGAGVGGGTLFALVLGCYLAWRKHHRAADSKSPIRPVVMGMIVADVSSITDHL